MNELQRFFPPCNQRITPDVIRPSRVPKDCKHPNMTHTVEFASDEYKHGFAVPNSHIHIPKVQLG